MEAVVSERQVRIPDAGVGLGKAGEAAEGEHGHEKRRREGAFCQSKAAGDLQNGGEESGEGCFFKEQIADHEKYHVAAEPCDGGAG